LSQIRKNELKVKCKTPECLNTFAKLGNQKYCDECNSKRKIWKNRNKRQHFKASPDIKKKTKLKTRRGLSLTIKFEDRFYQILEKFLAK